MHANRQKWEGFLENGSTTGWETGWEPDDRRVTGCTCRFLIGQKWIATVARGNGGDVDESRPSVARIGRPWITRDVEGWRRLRFHHLLYIVNEWGVAGTESLYLNS